MIRLSTRRGLRRQGFTALEFAGVCVIVAIIAGLVLNWGAHARERSRTVSCQSNLRQIGLALHMYADDFDGHLPHSNAVIPYLVAVYVKNVQILRCPTDANPAEIQTGVSEAETERDEEEATSGYYPWPPPLPATMECSYFIVPGLMTDDPPAELVAGDSEARHFGRWNAICLDGRVEMRSAEDLPPRLQ